LILLVPISIEAIAFDIRADWNFSEKLIS
jgi:hypothetical protein